MNVLAFDIGASSGRAILSGYDGTVLKMREVYRFGNGMVNRGGHLYWDVPDLFAEMQTGLKAAVSEGKIRSIGIDTWGVDGAFIDSAGALLDLPFGYRDFSVEMMQAAIAVLGEAELYRITGTQFLPFNTLFQFYRHSREHYRPYAIADRFLFMPDYLRFLFTGEKHTEYTIASTSQLIDAQKREWSSAILSEYGIRCGLLGEICEPGTPCGTVNETGIPAIAIGGHDTASAVLAVPAKAGDRSWAWLSSGTWSIMGIEAGGPIITAHARTCNFSNEGGINGTTRFLKNIMGLWIAQECQRLWSAQGNEYCYEELNNMVKKTAGTGSRIKVNDNRFLAPANMLEEIREACRETGQAIPATPGEIMRCILESLADEYAKTLCMLEDVTGNKVTVLHIVGGGSRNTVLNQMTADACGIPVLAGPDEAAAVGNSMMQLITLGELKNVEEGRQLVRASCEVRWYYPERE